MLFYLMNILLHCGEADDTSPVITTEQTIKFYLCNLFFFHVYILHPAVITQSLPSAFFHLPAFYECSGVRVWKSSVGSNTNLPSEPDVIENTWSDSCLARSKPWVSCSVSDRYMKAEEANSKKILLAR